MDEHEIRANSPRTAELVQAEARFRAAADTSPILMWSSDASGLCTWLNKPWLDFVGRQSDSQTRSGWSRDVHPGDLESCRLIYSQSFEAQAPFKMEYRLRRRDGVYRWMLDQGIPMYDRDGRFSGFVGSCVDIHEQKEAEAELRRSMAVTQTLFHVGITMAGELDSQKLIQSITDAATRLTGAEFGAFFYNDLDESGEAYMLYTLSGVPREAFAAFPMPRNTEVFGPTFRGAGIVRSNDITQDHRYGRNAPYHGMPPGHLPVRSYLAVPIVSRAGDVLGGLFFGHSQASVFGDEAERIAAGIASQAAVALDNARLYRQVQENESRFRQLANTIPQLAWMARPDGSVVWFNDRWYEFTGSKPEEAIGWGWQSAHDPATLPSVLERWQASIRHGIPFDMEFPLRGADGHYRWFLTRVMPLRDSAGRIVFWFGTHTDITEQRRLIEERQQLLEAEQAARAELERTSRMKDEFLATLSHELRTPLNAIVGWIELLKRHPQDEATVAEGLTVIARNTRAQTQLISDLLDMSRIITGKTRLDMHPVDVRSVIDAAVESVRPTAGAKGIIIRKTLDPLAGAVTGDCNRLQQILWNLLTNAIKFTPPTGHIEVRLERVSAHLEISVIDTGFGIRPEFLPHIFERFSQADSSITRRHSGLGIGLALVKNLVELHNGTVRARSAGEGRGSTFIVSLPVRVRRDEEIEGYQSTRAPSDQDAERGPPASLTGVKVLVIDDEPDARDLMRRLLEDYDASVFEAGSARSAVDLLGRIEPHLILSDIGMPDEDGFQFMRTLRAKGIHTPAVAVTAYARTDDRLRALRSGYQTHLPKPIDPAELIAVVASLTGRLSAR